MPDAAFSLDWISSPNQSYDAPLFGALLVLVVHCIQKDILVVDYSAPTNKMFVVRGSKWGTAANKQTSIVLCLISYYYKSLIVCQSELEVFSMLRDNFLTASASTTNGPAPILAPAHA